MVKKNTFGFLIVELLCIIFNICAPIDNHLMFCIISADIVIISNLILIVQNGFKDIALFFFNLTYFLFVLSGATSTIFEGNSVENYIGANLSHNESMTVGFIVLLGIITIDTLYYLTMNMPSITIDGRRERLTSVVRFTASRSQISFVTIVFTISAICKFMMAFENLVYSQSLGYVALYTRETSSLPSIIRYIGALFYFSLMLFLAAKLSKKATYFGMCITIGIEAIILGSGDRGEAVCGVLILIIYIINRCKQEPEFLQHKRTVIWLCVLSIPIAVYSLQVIKYIRVGNVNSLGFWDTFTEFFKSQGVSLGIVGHGITLRADIESLAGKNFVVKQILGYLQQNVLFRTIFRIPAIRGNTAAMATSGLSYGSSMAYLRFPSSYLNGVGCGTCFLAELFQDGRWVALVLGSGFIGVLLRKLRDFETNNWILMALALNCMRVVLMLPRGAYFKWITEIFSVPNLMLLIVVIILKNSRVYEE